MGHPRRPLRAVHSSPHPAYCVHTCAWGGGVLFVITIGLFVITVFCPYSVRILSVFCCFDRIRYSVHQKGIHRIRTEYGVFCPPEYMVRILSVFCVFCDSVEYGQNTAKIRRAPCILFGPQNTVFWGRFLPPPTPQPENMQNPCIFLLRQEYTKNRKNTYENTAQNTAFIEYRLVVQNTTKNTSENTEHNTAFIEYRLVVQNTTKNTSENTTQNTSRIEHWPEYNRIRDRIQQNTRDELVFYVWRRLGASSSEESDSHCKAGRTFRFCPPIFFAF